jgi:iron complex outermembrane receptor protein
LGASAGNAAAAEPGSLADLSIEELAQIEVTSVSRQPELLLETPSAIQVVTGDQIRRSGVVNIPEALRLATNLNVARQNAHEWIISARGFSSDVGNKLLVMMDGRTVYTPLFSGVFWDRQDYLLADIDQIEVISGPGGTLWGANAVNGVINILTKSAADTQGLYVEGGGGHLMQAFAGARYGGKLGTGTHYRVYGKYFQQGDHELSDGSGGRDDWAMGQGGFRVDSDLSGTDALTVQGDLYKNREQLFAGGRSETWGGNILGRWTRRFSDDSDMTLQLYYDRTDLSLPVAATAANPAGTFGDELDTVDVDFQHRFALGGSHNVIWGLGYRWTHDDVDNSPGLAFSDGNLTQSLFSGFVQDEFALVDDRVYLTVGTKLEHTDYTGLEVEPSARLQWNITERHMLWSAVSRAVRTPSRFDRDLFLPAPPPFTGFPLLAGSDDFESETLVAYELGFRSQIGSSIAGSLSFFYNDYDEIRSTGLTVPTILPFVFENNLEGETYGLELNLNWQVLDWWQLRAGYNFIEEELRVKSGSFDLNNALNETTDPKNQYSVRSSMDLPHNVELDAGFRWVDRLPAHDVATLVYVPSYGELDVRLAWRPTDSLEFSVTGQNLLHDSHQEFGLPGPSQEEIERNVFARIVWRN